jgi:hypothetical protein
MFVIYLVIHQKGIAQRFSLFKKYRWDKQNAKLITNMSAPLVFFSMRSALLPGSFFMFLLNETSHLTYRRPSPT